MPGIQLPKLTPEETEFLKLVANDNLNDIKSFLSKNKLNINCINFQVRNLFHKKNNPLNNLIL